MNVQCKEVTGRKCNQKDESGKCIYCGGKEKAKEGHSPAYSDYSAICTICLGRH